VDQLVGYGILPALGYHITLIFYVAGVPGTLILAWFHGKKGSQKPLAAEVWLLSVVGLIALGSTGVVVKNHLAERARDLEAAELGLDPNRVAVLYFDDLSRDKELGHLADGLTEALIGELAQVRALDVISRNGVEPFRDREVPRDSVARALNAGSLIDGSVERRGDELRVTVRLVDGVSGADVERATLRVPAGEWLTARDSVAERAGRILRRRLGDEVRLRGHKAGTTSVEAWGLVQRAERLRKAAEARLRDDQLEDALVGFERADSVLALAEAADRKWVEPIVLRAHIAFRRARTAEYLDDIRTVLEQIDSGIGHANRALALAPNNARALEQRGTLEYFHWLLDMTPDPAEDDRLLTAAREDLEAAVRFDPTLATALSLLSHLYFNAEDQVSVLLTARRAYEEDAYLADADQILSRLFFGYYNLGRLTEAQRWCNEGSARFPNDYLFVECQLRMLATARGVPDVDRAWRLLAKMDSVAPEERRGYWHRRGQIFVAGVIGRAGNMDSANSVLLRARGDRQNDPRNELASYEAAVQTMLGQYDQAIELLKAYVAANPDHAFEVGENLHWWWQPLKDHPRFQTLVASGR
jgi:serine/threonine-protein kinase